MLPQHCFLIPVNNPTPSYSLFKMWPFVLSRDATRLSWSPIFILKPPSGPQLEMLCSQFLAKAMQSMHIFHSMVTSPGPGRMKETLYSHTIKFVEKHLTDRVFSESCYKCAINNIHSAAVASLWCLAALLNLPRRGELTLYLPLCTFPAKIRKIYKIGRAYANTCPEYKLLSHTSAHFSPAPLM
jgi:hypothetical protein